MSLDTDLWTFKHEPKKLEQMVLDPGVRNSFKKILKSMPNILLYGKPGVGKGTFTHILLKETKYDSIWINASDETGIDVMRDKVKSFATSMGISKMKVVVLNEADSLTSGPQGSQKALRQIMEDVQKITRFILLANYEHQLIPELKSRCQVIEVVPPPGKDLLAFCEKVLKSECVKYDNKTLISIIKKCHPDVRKTIDTLQINTENKVLKTDIVSRSESVFKEILGAMLVKDPEKTRNILKSNVVDYIGLYSFLFDNAGEFGSPADAILEIGEHAYRNDLVAIREINFIHMFVSMIKKGVI